MSRRGERGGAAEPADDGGEDDGDFFGGDAPVAARYAHDLPACATLAGRWHWHRVSEGQFAHSSRRSSAS